MQVIFELRDLLARQILAVDGDCLVYLDSDNLVVYSWRNPAGIFRWPSADERFFNGHFFPDRVLIMSSSQLFTFWKTEGKFQQLPLPLPAIAEFVCQGEHIFYGSSQRQLVKYSLRKNKLVWKLKLGQNLERQPFICGGAIVISPADNNVMQLNGRGSVSWWLALESILQFNMVPMADHLAAFLINHEIKFINPRRQLLQVFKIKGRPAGMPLAYKHDLYFFLSAGKTQKLQRVGNRYDIEITLAADKMQLPGIPITFSILTNNLLRPSLQCVIRDEAGQTVLAKNIALADQTVLVWIPARAGVYRLRVSAAALNRTEEKEISFKVFDPLAIVPKFRFHF